MFTRLPDQKWTVDRKVKVERKRRVSLESLILSVVLKPLTLMNLGGKPFIFQLIIPFYVIPFSNPQNLTAWEGKKRVANESVLWNTLTR